MIGQVPVLGRMTGREPMFSPFAKNAARKSPSSPSNGSQMTAAHNGVNSSSNDYLGNHSWRHSSFWFDHRSDSFVLSIERSTPCFGTCDVPQVRQWGLGRVGDIRIME
jgi:hypothetical protein